MSFRLSNTSPTFGQCYLTNYGQPKTATVAVLTNQIELAEDTALTLALLISQAQATLDKLGEEPTERTQARIRVMTATLQDLRKETKIDQLTWSNNQPTATNERL